MKRKTIIGLVILAFADLLLSLWMGQQSYRWMPPQASAESMLVDNLFSFMTTLGSFIFFGVMGTILYSILFQQAAKYDASDGPPIEGNLKLEIIWTAIPIILVLWIGTVSYQTYDTMGILGPMEHDHGAMGSAIASPMEDSSTDPIEVYARQWAWEFRYPGTPQVRSTELHLPVNQRAKLKLLSEDVLHGFFVPAFRIKQDVVPGRAIDFEFTPIREGRYRLRDSEFSGTYFAANQTNVVVEPEDAYQQWLLAAAKTPLAPAENVAAAEFEQVQKSSGLHWVTVQPAPAPLVNYTSSEQDSHE